MKLLSSLDLSGMTKYRIVGSFTLFFGILQIIYPLVYALFVFPETQYSLGTNLPPETPNRIAYTTILFVGLLGIANLLTSWKLWSNVKDGNDLFVKIGIFLLVINIIIADLPAISEKMMGDDIKINDAVEVFEAET